MRKYRLKPEAAPFFADDVATKINTFDFWKEHNVDMKALEEVEECYVTYGYSKGERVQSLCGWANDGGSQFCFTIHFPSAKYREHDQFSKGKVVRKLMDEIQRKINCFYEQFNNGEIE